MGDSTVGNPDGDCLRVGFLFPDIHERAVLAAEQQKEVGGGNLIATTANPKAVVEQSKDLNAQLKITLPEGISKADVEIENDYVTQTIYIKFAGGVDDYFEQYAIKGSSDHIASMAYYKDKEEGVIALQLDQVYELKNRFKKGSLYLDFIDPHDIYDKVIVVDAGHGSHAAGAVKLGISEKSLNLAIVQQLKNCLMRINAGSGCTIHVHRTRIRRWIRGFSWQIRQMRICLSAYITIRMQPETLPK